MFILVFLHLESRLNLEFDENNYFISNKSIKQCEHKKYYSIKVLLYKYVKMGACINTFLKTEITFIPGLLEKCFGKYYNNTLCNGATWMTLFWYFLHVFFDQFLNVFFLIFFIRFHLCNTICRFFYGVCDIKNMSEFD